MPDVPKKVKNYLAALPKDTGEKNAGLISDFCAAYLALPSEPSEGRVKQSASRLKAISLMVDNKPFDELKETDLAQLNLKMRERGMKSAQDYRKILKRLFVLKDKKQFLPLIDSPYLKAPRRKSNAPKLVDANRFWSQDEIDRYLDESKRYSARQAAWAGLWLSTGCRPSELLALRKQDIEKSNGNLIVKVQQGKTGSRTIVLQEQEASGVWLLIEPWLSTLAPEERIIGVTYEMELKIHCMICKRAKIAENKDKNFYMARKLCLSRFYNSFGMVKAAQMSGHTAGSAVMKHYVNLSDAELTGGACAKVATKLCPNPSCGAENAPQVSQCGICGSPTNREQFAALFKGEIKKLIAAAWAEDAAKKH